MQVTFFGREKFVYREADAVEQFAWVVVGCTDAFLFRDAEVVCRNQELNLALELHNREDTD